jgi:hypothetical protein
MLIKLEGVGWRLSKSEGQQRAVGGLCIVNPA